MKKSNSDKRFKLPSGVEHTRPTKTTFETEAEAQEGEEIDKEEENEEQQEIEEVDVDVDADITESDDATVASLQEQNGGEDADDDLELPPPMKPITEPILVTTANGPSGSTIPNELPGKRVSIWIVLLMFDFIASSSKFNRFSLGALQYFIFLLHNRFILSIVR